MSLVDTWTVACPNYFSGIAPRRYCLVSRSASGDRRDVKKSFEKNRSKKMSLTLLLCSHTPEMFVKKCEALDYGPARDSEVRRKT